MKKMKIFSILGLGLLLITSSSCSRMITHMAVRTLTRTAVLVTIAAIENNCSYCDYEGNRYQIYQQYDMYGNPYYFINTNCGMVLVTPNR